MAITINPTVTAAQDVHLVTVSDDGHYAIRIASDKLPRGQRFIGSVQVTGLDEVTLTPFTHYAHRSVFTDAQVQFNLLRNYVRPVDAADPSKGVKLGAFSWENAVIETMAKRKAAYSPAPVLPDWSGSILPEDMARILGDAERDLNFAPIIYYPEASGTSQDLDPLIEAVENLSRKPA